MKIQNTLALLLLSLSACWIGCKPAGQEALALLDSQASEIKIDDLARTMDFVASENQFQQEEFVEKVTTGMNRWVSTFPEKFANDSWKLDPLAKPLVDEYSDLAIVQLVDQLDFANTDAFYLQQQSWMQKIANRLVASNDLMCWELLRIAANEFQPGEDAENPLADIVKHVHSDLDNSQAADLANGLKLFDWLIRNVQLLPETVHEADAIDDLRLNDKTDSLASAGVMGTGYTRFAWQVLLYGQGDYVERAKTFMILARQAGINSVLLAVKDGENTRPWCVALLIGDTADKMYLFDTKMGLPIPGETLGTIATLADVRANPTLLDSLDLTLEESLAENTKYWVKSGDLKSLQALIYCSPEGISRRVYHLERNLTADYRLRLSDSVGKIAKQIESVEGLESKVWDIGFQTHTFRQALRDAKTLSYRDDLKDKITWHFLNESYIDEFPLYRTSRSMFFNGNFESERNSTRKNAIENFYSLMYSDKTIDSLGTDKFLQRRLGITQDEGLAVAEFQKRIQIMKGKMKLVRRDSGYFLTQCHFDNGNPGATVTWLLKFKDKTGMDSPERWKDGMHYLLARSYETRKEYDKAMNVYREQKDSMQVHGNLIRTRMLKELTERLSQP